MDIKIVQGKILSTSHDLENEKIVSALTGIASKAANFWQWSQVLLDAVGEREFIRQLERTLEILKEDGQDDLKEAIITTEKTFDLYCLYILANGNDRGGRFLSNNKLIVYFSESTNSELRHLIAWNHNTPIKILEKLSFDSNRDVVRGVCQHKKVPFRILERISYHPEARWRRASVLNAKSQSLYRRMASDECEEIRSQVAIRTKDINVIKILQKDKDDYVRESLLFNDDVPLGFLEDYAQGDNAILAEAAKEKIAERGRSALRAE